MGSGTTALEANLRSFNAFGLEVDPYARLIGEASVEQLTKSDLETMVSFTNDIESLFKGTRSLSSMIPDIPNIEHWFSKKAISDLTRIKRLVLEYTEARPKYRSFLLAAFGDIIRGVSNAERQSLKPYVSSRFEKIPGDALVLFKKCLEKYLSGAKAVSQLSEYGPGKINWVKGDATKFVLKDSIDVAITSPPYINAMDYVRCIRLESSWVGTGTGEIFSDVRASQVGESARIKARPVSEVVVKVIKADYDNIFNLDKSRAKTLAAYFEDMHQNLRCVFASLKPGSCYHIIVGDSVVRGIPVATHRHIADIAQLVGFEWKAYFKYEIKDHRTSLPRNGRGGKIDAENVVTLLKP
jgi:DNA modification methylase